jgi:cytochrome c5
VALALAGCSNPPPIEQPAPAAVREPDYRRGMLTYRIFCAACHDGTHDEAPTLDDIEAWDERTFEWESVLRQHAARDFLEMPPNGELSEESVSDALFYMETQIKVLDE